VPGVFIVFVEQREDPGLRLWDERRDAKSILFESRRKLAQVVGGTCNGEHLSDEAVQLRSESGELCAEITDYLASTRDPRPEAAS
jgi:hypothetical protein